MSMVRQGAELRRRKQILPNPRKPEKQHYRNLVAQNAIRANLFDALGNYKYCSACIIHTFGIGSQRLACQRSIKQREAITPHVDMSKSEAVNDRLQKFVVLPEGIDKFSMWWATVEDDDQVKVCYSHGLAQTLKLRKTVSGRIFLNSLMRSTGSAGAITTLPKIHTTW